MQSPANRHSIDTYESRNQKIKTVINFKENS